MNPKKLKFLGSFVSESAFRKPDRFCKKIKKQNTMLTNNKVADGCSANANLYLFNQHLGSETKNYFLSPQQTGQVKLTSWDSASKLSRHRPLLST
jgi:hypothetical protein